MSDKWGAYLHPWRNTSGNGVHHPARVMSFQGGMMDFWIHSEAIDGVMRPLVAAPQANVLSNAQWARACGRYAVRFRSDALQGAPA